MHHRSWRLSPALAACALALLVSNGIARAQTAGAPPPDFGSAPSGEIPILFSPLDKHVYAKPDRLRHGRVLAALVRGGTILVPLRSLFEQLGATVAYDASARSVEVSKAGSDLKLTVGEPSVTINGETRPLDVAPEEVRGVVFVPLRVIAEAMGAYVVWVPDKQVVVVRYVPPPSPPPAPAYTPPPAQATPEPTRVPKPVRTPYYERFAAADYLIGPATYNELDPGNPTYGNTFDARAVAELPLGTGRIMIEGDYQGLEFRHNSTLGPSGCSAKSAGCGTVIGSDPNYQTGYCPSSDPGCVTVIGYQNLQSSIGLGQAYATSFTAYETDFQGHLAYQVAAPRIYVGIGGYVNPNPAALGRSGGRGVDFPTAKVARSAGTGENGMFQSHQGANLPSLSPAMVAPPGRSWCG